MAKRLRRRSRKPKIEGSNPSQAFFFLFRDGGRGAADDGISLHCYF